MLPVRVAVAFLSISLLAGCASAPKYRGAGVDTPHTPGSVERVEYLKSYSSFRLRLMLALARLPAHISVENGVHLYRVRYWTEHLGQTRTGLRAVCAAGPGNAEGNSRMAERNRSKAGRGAIIRGPDAVLISASFAGSGFLLLSPDLVGLGQSQEYHPYLYGASTVAATRDFVHAAKEVGTGLGVATPPQLMLVGFSQGGYSTAVVQRALERRPEPGVVLLGSAAIAPPLNLADIAVPFALNGHSTADTVYLAFLAHAYSHIYGRPLASLLTDPYASIAPTLFDGAHSVDEILAKLPNNHQEIFRHDVIEAYLEGQASWFRSTLRENEAYDWAPKASLRLYYGDRDTDVSPEDPKCAVIAMKKLGGALEPIDVGPYDHNGVVYHSVPLVQRWLEELSRQAAGR